MKFDFGYSKFSDEHIQRLVTRCSDLKELRLLGRGNISNDAVMCIIDHLKQSLEKLVISGCLTDNKKMFDLRLMPKLKTLGFFMGVLRSEDMNDVKIIEIRNQLPNVSVTECPPCTEEEKN